MKIIIEIEEDRIKNVEIEKEQKESKQSYVLDVYRIRRLFDKTCPKWSNDYKANIYMLQHCKQYANSVLKAKGYLFLNELYEILSMSKREFNLNIGWIYNGQDEIDFWYLSTVDGFYPDPSEKKIALTFKGYGIIDKF